MSRRQRGLSPTLFPFLAVLVCTLGTLILLLALVAQNATAHSAAAKEPSKNTNASAGVSNDEITQLIREEVFKVEALTAIRTAQTRDIENQRDQRTHLEDHIQRIKARIQQLRTEIQISSSSDIPDIITEEELATATSQLDRLRKTVDELRQQSEDPDPKVVIVPHKGPNGTERRAVYLECVADAIIIWPEGSRLTIEQLQNSTKSANPLDAALRVIRLHALKIYGDSIAPYPLLIVRPEGINTYAAARQAMRTWDDQFGYELVASNTELRFPAEDKTLRDRIDAAILEASENQKSEIRAGIANRTLGLNHRKTNKAPVNLPTLSAAAMERSSRANGYRQLRDPSLSGSSFENPSQTNDNRTEKHFSSHKNDHAKTDNPSQQFPNPAQGQQPGKPERTQEPSRPTSVPKAPSYTSPYRSLSTKSMQMAKGQIHQDTTTANDTLQPQIPDASEAASLYSGDVLQGDEAPFKGSSAQTAQSHRKDNTSVSDRIDSANHLDHEITSKAEFNQNRTGSANEGRSEPALGSSQMINPLSQSKTGGSSSAIGSAMQSSDATMNNPPKMTQRQRKPKVDTTSRRTAISKIGNQWAVPKAVSQMRGNAIVRIIRVKLYEDRITLMPSRNATSIEVFSFFDGDLERASLQLAAAIYERIEQWGPALPGARWQPTLEIAVQPTHLSEFELLKRHLGGSGLQIKLQEP